MIRISGVVRLPDDPEGIEVVVQIVNDRLVLKRARTSLGDYALSEVGVTQLSSEVFELDIDGEQLHFLPSNPRLFASLEFVLHATRRSIANPSKKTRRTEEPRKKDKRARQPAHVPKEVPAEAAPIAEQVPVTPQRAEPPTPKPEVLPTPETPEQEAIEVDLTEQTISPNRSRRFASRTKYLGAATRDQLRQTGIWPLDRLKALSDDDALPVEHEHTYLAVTTHAGLVRRVCTECGHVSLDIIEGTLAEEPEGQ